MQIKVFVFSLVVVGLLHFNIIGLGIGGKPILSGRDGFVTKMFLINVQGVRLIIVARIG